MLVEIGYTFFTTNIFPPSCFPPWKNSFQSIHCRIPTQDEELHICRTELNRRVGVEMLYVKVHTLYLKTQEEDVKGKTRVNALH